MNRAKSLYNANKFLIIAWLVVYASLFLNSYFEIIGDGLMSFIMFFAVIIIFICLCTLCLYFGLTGFFHAKDLKKSVVAEDIASAEKLKLVSGISLFSIIFCALFIFYLMAIASGGLG
jgi:hypothetical protein